jgi:signal transduction histidine kinase
MGKYRNIIISVALFLILDAGVLMLNFIMSFQISEDAVAVNIAGRQRMLSQRITKSLLETDYSLINRIEREKTLDELAKSVNLFENTINAFTTGGVTTSANGFPVTISAAESIKAKRAIEDAQIIWDEYHSLVKLLIAEGKDINNPMFAVRLKDAIQFGKQENVALLTLMNDLTVELEKIASSKANQLRLIQTVGISLAILNFFLIMFHFMRQLRESDALIESARQETQEILETVSEGLFLLDDELIIGSQYSKELVEIFGRSDIAGTSFKDLLKKLISENDMSTAESFIKLLFKPTVNQKLIGELNPLREIEIHIANDNGQYESKYLNFQFSRVRSQKGISHVLTTVTDVTRQILLSRELDNARSQNEQQMEMLSTIMHANGDLMPVFVKNGFDLLEKVNNVLRLPSKSHMQHKGKIQQIFSFMHAFKGEASALGLTPFADMAHRFEDELEVLNTNENLAGNDFLSLTVLLNQMLRQLEAADKLIQRLASLASAPTESGLVTSMDWSHLQDLADDIANRQAKAVDVIYSGLNDHTLAETSLTAINQICIQLIRNSVTHGIETVEDRRALQKPTNAEIDIRLCRLRNNEWRLTVQDDGTGLDIESIRLKAVENKLISEEQSEHMDRKQLIGLIFSPNLSTADTVDGDAGRGMGMSVISDLIRDQGGKLNVATRKNSGCTFTITLPADANALIEAA